MGRKDDKSFEDFMVETAMEMTSEEASETATIPKEAEQMRAAAAWRNGS